MIIINHALLLICFVYTSNCIGQIPKTELIGSWKLQQIHYQYTDTTYIAKDIDYGRFIFTENRYVVMYNPRMQERVPFSNLSKPNNEETIAAFRSIAFNTGKYIIANGICINTADIAKVPGFEGGKQFYKIKKYTNKNLELTMFDEIYPDGQKPEWFGKLKIKFVLKRE